MPVVLYDSGQFGDGCDRARGLSRTADIHTDQQIFQYREYCIYYEFPKEEKKLTRYKQNCAYVIDKSLFYSFERSQQTDNTA